MCGTVLMVLTGMLLHTSLNGVLAMARSLLFSRIGCGSLAGHRPLVIHTDQVPSAQMQAKDLGAVDFSRAAKAMMSGWILLAQLGSMT